MAAQTEAEAKWRSAEAKAKTNTEAKQPEASRLWPRCRGLQV